VARFLLDSGDLMGVTRLELALDLICPTFLSWNVIEELSLTADASHTNSLSFGFIDAYMLPDEIL